MQKLDYKDARAVFYTRFVLRCYKHKTRLELSQFCTGSVTRALKSEVEEQRAVTSKHLVTD
jgi:hypothetical protein